MSKSKVTSIHDHRDQPEGTPLEKVPDPELGHNVIPAERYTSTEFMALEWEHMWTKVWLLGCLEDDIAEPGDYCVTEIGRESVLISRQPDGSIRAFYNVCQHRGNRLMPPGLGSVEEESFRCHYHHWEYNLDGSFKRIPDITTFPQGRPPCSGLTELPCGRWGPWVFFSLNQNIEPLSDYLDVLPEHLAPYRLERMVMTRDMTIEWDCNWKASVDAFNESYHVQGIHPQLLWHLDDLNLQIDCFEKHSRYLIKFLTLSPRVNTPPEIPPGIKEEMKKAGMDPADYGGKISDIRRDVQKHKRIYGAQQGKDYSALSDTQLTDDFHYLIFPHVTLNVHADDYWLFRQRPHPTDPDKMFFDIWTFEYQTEQDWEDGEPPERPRHRQFKHGDKSIGLVLDQDAFNLPTVQQGMHSAGFQGLWIGRQELRIRHFHKVLNDYIEGPTGTEE